MFATKLKNYLHLKNCGSPLEAGDHPETDETDIVDAGQISIY